MVLSPEGMALTPATIADSCSGFVNAIGKDKVGYINYAIGLGSSSYKLVISEPAPEQDFWFPPYTPERTVNLVHKERWRAGIWMPDFPTTFDEPHLSIEELSRRPVGKVGEVEIADLTEE